MTEFETKWLARVRDWRASGQTAVAFCAGKGFPCGTLSYWASRLRKAGYLGEIERMPVARVVRVASPSLPAPPGAAVDSPVVIDLGVARVAVRPGFDRATLAAVVEILAARGGAR